MQFHMEQFHSSMQQNFHEVGHHAKFKLILIIKKNKKEELQLIKMKVENAYHLQINQL